MIDQLIIGSKATNDDFGASVKSRNIKDPEKKKITKTVPFSNAIYDFTKINGEIYWNPRELEYVFEMIAPTPEELEEMKAAFSNFVMNVIEEEIHDPFIPDYHFIGTYENKSYEDDESGEKTTITVTFLAYPYKIANAPKVYSINIKRDETKAVSIYNNGSHRVVPYFRNATAVHFTFKNTSYVPNKSDFTHEDIILDVGENVFYFSAAFYVESITDRTFEVCFIEEVL